MNQSIKGVIWVTGVYFYFLIFAQFSFLELLAAQSFDADALKLVMAPMAIGGVMGSFSVLWLLKRVDWMVLMRISAGVCAMMSMLASAAWSMGLAGYAALAFCVGSALGILTVLLASNLPHIFNGSKGVYWGSGIGTGLAYMLSNLPWVFQATAVEQSLASCFAMLILCFLSLKKQPVSPLSYPRELKNFPLGVLCFTMLVWLDSAAFYIIQHTRELKLVTWGETMLWRNGAVHLIVALIAVWLLLRGKIKWVLGFAFLILAMAGLMASSEGFKMAAGYLYPAGVSLYSVALIIYPVVWLGGQGGSLRAAVLFAVAGWVGSSLGIGMAQDLHRVPMAFVMVAGLVMFVCLGWPWLRLRSRELFACLFVAGICFSVYLATGDQVTNRGSDVQNLTLIDQGRQVYISEGCIHCHSQYVRPESRDELLWGPVRSLDEVTAQAPVLIGNRRQGPDLLRVGLRRSPGWLKQHFIDPQSLVPNSCMPSYAHLFSDSRGEALVAYLAAYDADDMTERLKAIYGWSPNGHLQPSGQGVALFAEHCAACHGSDGRGNGALSSLWARSPANLVQGPFPFTPAADESLARAIKFGIPGTDMPGHETLPNMDLKALVDYVTTMRKSPDTNTKTP
jgi:hypothetical protein